MQFSPVSCHFRPPFLTAAVTNGIRTVDAGQLLRHAGAAAPGNSRVCHIHTWDIQQRYSASVCILRNFTDI
jgi:hypothetical protein